VFKATYDPVTQQEIAGGCRHKIVSGTGDFAGATGRINFTDNVTNGTSSYRGYIRLADRHRVAFAKAAAAVSRPSSMC
jgi:hypothetical protein